MPYYWGDRQGTTRGHWGREIDNFSVLVIVVVVFLFGFVAGGLTVAIY